MQSSSKKCFYARYGCKRKWLMYILGVTDKIKTEYENDFECSNPQYPHP